MSLHQTIAAPQPFAGPLYAQVAAVLRAKITALEWKPAHPLPNEARLAKEIGVSIGTVRKALEMLEEERLIDRRQGRGTFVVEISQETELARYSNLVSSGKKLKADPARMAVSSGVAGTDECARLNLRTGDSVIRFDGIWTAGTSLRAYERISVPALRFPGLETADVQSGQFLFPLYRRNYHVVIAKVTEHVTPACADLSMAKKLDVPEHTPVLKIERIARAAGIGPVEYSLRYACLTNASYTVSMI